MDTDNLTQSQELEKKLKPLTIEDDEAYCKVVCKPGTYGLTTKIKRTDIARALHLIRVYTDAEKVIIDGKEIDIREGSSWTV